MTSRELLELKVKDLYFEDQTVIWKTVKKYMKKFEKEECIDPIYVTHCTHNNQDYISEGHNRTAAAHLQEKETIKANVRNCVPECNGDSFYDPSFSIDKVKVLSWKGLIKKSLNEYKK